MSNDIQKADQIAYRLFTKLTLVVNQARLTAEPSSSRAQPKVDKWFNLETPDSDIFRDHLRIYRSVSSTPPPPFELQVLLSVPELTSNQVLVYQAPDSSRVRIEPTPRHILLETWLLVFSPTPSSPSSSSRQQQQYRYGEVDSSASTSSSSGEVAPSTIYKHCITLFRSLFSLLRILPAWRLHKRLRRRTGGGNRNGSLGIRLRVRGLGMDEGDSIAVDESILGFDEHPSHTAHPFPTETHVFPSVPHPMGTLSLTTRYLSTPNFHLDELESLLSSRFLSLDEGPEFTPTLASKGPQQKGDLSAFGTSPLGSLPIRTSLPMSPPSSVADRFILPATGSGPMQLHSRTTSLPSHQPSSSKSNSNPDSPKHLNVPLPVLRTATTTATNSATLHGGTATIAAPAGATPGTPAGSGSGSGISVGSSSRGHDVGGTSSAWSKDDASGKPVSGIAARVRKESTGTGRGADLPSSPGPLPIRRPSINPVHPFKASTLSSGSPSLHSPSPSLRQPSPLSSASTGGPSLPARPFPTSPTTTTATARGVPVPPSPIGMGSRPSPPLAPSSLGDRRSLASAEGEEPPSPKTQGQAQGQGKKRYSSSFSKRYSATGPGGSGSGSGVGGGAGSEGSAGSAERERERKDGDRVASGGSFLSNNTDDDDISIFVQEIDARKPLSGHQRIRSHDRDATATGRRLGGGGRGDDHHQIAGLLSTDEHASSSTAPMLTSESEVDERLRQMNRTFLESLEGLGGRRRERTSSSAVPSGEGDDGSERSSEPDPPLGRMSTEGRGSRESGSGIGGGNSTGGRLGRGRGLVLPPRPRVDSRSTSTSDVQGSDEVLGRLSLDDERSRGK